MELELRPEGGVVMQGLGVGFCWYLSRGGWLDYPTGQVGEICSRVWWG